MEKINPSVQRSFSDLITVTINFMKQEFIPFIRAFAVIGFPVILLVVFLMKDMLMSALDASINPQGYGTEAFGGIFERALFTGLFAGVMMLWIQLFSMAYLRVYWDHYRSGNQEQVTINEVLQMMLKKLGVYILWSLFYGLVVVLGFIFFFIPGVYLAVALVFGGYLLVLRDNGLNRIMTEAMGMVKHNWWRVFGYAIILQLLVYVVAFLFSIPYMGVTVSAAVTGEVPNIYVITFTLLLSYIGQYTLFTVMFVGMGMLFFSRSEEMEHTTLLSKIDQMGAKSKKTDEMAD